MIVLRELADRLGHDPSAVRRQARVLGVHLEKRWVRSPQGTKQPTLVTDQVGERVLSDWYRTRIT